MEGPPLLELDQGKGFLFNLLPRSQGNNRKPERVADHLEHLQGPLKEGFVSGYVLITQNEGGQQLTCTGFVIT